MEASENLSQALSQAARACAQAAASAAADAPQGGHVEGLANAAKALSEALALTRTDFDSLA